MKKYSFILAFVFLAFANSFAQSVMETKPGSEIKLTGPVASFDRTVFDFDELVQGNPGTASFVVTNDGNEPLIITSARASCGCTNLNWTKDPILPGKSSTISVTYNASTVGSFNKTVTIRLNSDDKPVSLIVKGKVVSKV